MICSFGGIVESHSIILIQAAVNFTLEGERRRSFPVLFLLLLFLFSLLSCYTYSPKRRRRQRRHGFSNARMGGKREDVEEEERNVTLPGSGKEEEDENK